MDTFAYIEQNIKPDLREPKKKIKATAQKFEELEYISQQKKRTRKSKLIYAISLSCSSIALLIFIWILQSHFKLIVNLYGTLFAFTLYVISFLILVWMTRTNLNRNNLAYTKQKMLLSDPNKIKFKIRTEIANSNIVKETEGLKTLKKLKDSKKFDYKKIEEEITNKKKRVEEIKEETKIKDIRNVRNPVFTLTLKDGSIRGFLMLCIALVVFFYIIDNLIIPVYFLIPISIIFIYYEIIPKEILPKKLQTTIPEKYGTIDRITKLSSYLDNILNRLENFKENIIKSFKNLNNEINQLDSLAKEPFNKINDQIENIAKLIESFTIKTKSTLEQIGLSILIIVVGVIGAIYLENTENLFDILNVGVASILASVSIALGLNIQEVMINKVKPEIENAFNDVLDGIDEIKKDINNAGNRIIDILGSIEKSIIKLKTSNLLIFAPKDLVAAISINVMIFVCAVALIFPLSNIGIYLIVAMEMVIGYYFMTHK